MIELPEPIEFNEFIQPVKLPTDCGNDLAAKFGIFIGAGQTEDLERTKILLRHAYLQIMSENEFNELEPDQQITSKILAYPRNGQTPGQGDSGTFHTHNMSVCFFISRAVWSIFLSLFCHCF